MRMGMRRFTRLTDAFSKKLENLEHNVALFSCTIISAGFTPACALPQQWKRELQIAFGAWKKLWLSCLDFQKIGFRLVNSKDMKRPNRWLDLVIMGSFLVCFTSLGVMAYYFVWAKIDPSMEHMWIMKRRTSLPLLVVSIVVGLPFWIRFVLICIRRRKDLRTRRNAEAKR
jgi:hypothetical protein